VHEGGEQPVRVVITAATGLIGSALAAGLQADGVDVLRLVRRPPSGPGEVRWDPAAADGGLDPATLDGADAVVHLSGAPVAPGRWTAARKLELRSSRIASTAALVRVMLAASKPPPVLLAASAIGWYGDTGDRAVDETAPNGAGFLAALARDWEAAAEPARAAGIRVVSLRSGVVLSARGGMLATLLPPFRLGLGARIGAGTQYLSWITLADHVRAARFLLGSSEIDGPVNMTAPGPVTSAQFTAALAAAVHRPAVLRLPAGLLRLALGEVSGELLGSCRVLPGRLQRAGFTFTHASVGPAVAAAVADR
jgi:uncharacterized protein